MEEHIDLRDQAGRLRRFLLSSAVGIALGGLVMWIAMGVVRPEGAGHWMAGHGRLKAVGTFAAIGLFAGYFATLRFLIWRDARRDRPTARVVSE